MRSSSSVAFQLKILLPESLTSSDGILSNLFPVNYQLLTEGAEHLYYEYEDNVDE